jgi:uncharacterized membrane protein
MTKTSRTSFFRLDSHYRLYVALVLSIITFFATRQLFSAAEVALFTWLAFALSIIILEWVIIFTCHPREIRKIASLEDSSRTFIFILVVSAAVVSLGAVIFLLKSPKEATDTQVTGHVLISIASVIISWWLVHTIFTMRYAHLYYTTNPDGDKKKPIGGLQFPDEPEPDYLDFVYFSFVLGTTFQVSDVEISSRPIRRLALVHGLIAFAFNTAILALSINVVSGLVSPH